MTQTAPRRLGISRLDLMIFGLVLLILGIGLGVSWQVQRLILQADVAQQRERVNTLARTVRDAFEVELGHATSAVDAAAHFASFQSQLTPDVWHSFAVSTLERFPQIRQLAWAPLVKANERERFVEQVQRAGSPDYHITMLNAAGETVSAAAADQYLPLLFVEPAAPERIGRDQMRNPSWVTAFRASRDAAEPAFSTAEPADCASVSVRPSAAAPPSACIDLVAASFLNGRPDTMFGRRLNYRGAVTAVLSYQVLMQEAVRRARAAQLDLWLFDRDSNVRLAFSDVAALPTAAGSAAAQLAMAGFQPQESDTVLSVISSSRAWEIVLRPQPVAAGPGLSPAALAGLIGVVCTLLIAGLLLAVGYGIRETARARAEAEAAAQAKTTFLANMSHEIRTPMNAVIGLAHLALRTDLSPKQRDYIEKVHTAGQSLLGIINDVLDFSKIEAGHLEMERTAFELDHVLSQAATVTAHKAADSGLELLFDVDDNVPQQLIGDPLRLGQVLINLINNAIKFTERGQIVVRCALAKTLDAERGATPKLLLRFSVQDSGIGMTPEQCTRLFTAFSQADESTTRKYGGTGLGLSISKRMVELTGGQISAESEWGVGSTFQFTWGCEIDPLARVAPQPVPELLVGLRVLLVDDNAAARTILSHALISLGCEAEAVPDAVTALQRLAEEDAERPFGLLLTDWSMPGMDGLDLARAVRTSTTLRHAPKILLATAFGREDAFESVEGVYLDGVVIKPVARPVLIDALLAVMHGEEKVATPGHRQAEAVPHLQGVRVLLAEDNEINQQIAVELITFTMAEVDVADNGSIALDRLHAHGPAHYQVVLLDMQMPVLDGYETARRIRSDRRYAGLPIVAMTAHALVEERARCLAAGMDDHVAKPIDPAVLYEALVRWTGGPRGGVGSASTAEIIGAVAPVAASDQPAGTAAPALPSANLASLAAQVPQLDVVGAMRRVAQNSGLYLQLLKRFCVSQADLPERVRESLARGDAHQAELLAHTLKGVAANIGADALATHAGALESGLRDGDKSVTVSGGPLEATQAALQTLLTPLRAWLEASESTATFGPADQQRPQVSSDQSRAAFAALRQRLQDMDSSAADELVALLPQLRQSMPAERLQQVEQLVASFDFDEALNLLPETID
jgi:signal transduction histidine kinase/DNA-binding response OmpR family regulator/HPt (histidine-containing phosphotransfer) domain-containing protein